MTTATYTTALGHRATAEISSIAGDGSPGTVIYLVGGGLLVLALSFFEMCPIKVSYTDKSGKRHTFEKEPKRSVEQKILAALKLKRATAIRYYSRNKGRINLGMAKKRTDKRKQKEANHGG